MNSKLTGKGDEEEGVKKTIDIFTYKQRILSIDMKTKVCNFEIFASSQTFLAGNQLYEL